MRILVTDGDARAALAVVRGLGRHGHVVYVSASRLCSLAGVSRYCAGEYPQAAADASPLGLARSIAALARDLEVDLVLATIDRTLTALHRTGVDLGGAGMPPPHRRAYLDASDKVWLFHACRRIGIPVPDGVAPAGGSLPDRGVLESLGREWVVRPALSWRWAAGGWVQGHARVVRGRSELARLVETDPALSQPYLIQRRLPGEGCGLFLLARNGRMLRVFSHRRLREKPPWGGVSTLCVSVAPPAELLAAAERFVEAERWSGLAMLEFKRDLDGAPHLLEINARPWGSMALAQAAGVDFATALVESASLPTPPQPYREGLRLRWWWGDVDHFFIDEKHRGGNPARVRLRALARVALAGPWAESWDTLQLDDPLPFARETAAWMTRS